MKIIKHKVFYLNNEDFKFYFKLIFFKYKNLLNEILFKMFNIYNYNF
jgi:hypothetical protein